MSEKQVNTAVDETTTATLEKIEAKYGTKAPALARKLLETACQFFEKNGYFHFPVLIEPISELSVNEQGEPAARRPTRGPALTLAQMRRMSVKANRALNPNPKPKE